MLDSRQSSKSEALRVDDSGLRPSPAADLAQATTTLKTHSFRASRRYWDKYGQHIAMLMAVSAIANFLYFKTFGIYEDDWAFMVPPYTVPTGTWLAGMWRAVTTFMVGRPLQLFYTDGFAWLGAKAGSLSLLYVISAFLYAISVALLYLAIRQRFPAFFALLTALLFALSPLTTIRQLLHAVVGTAPGFICLFLALIFYARRKAAWSYPLAVMALLSYEPIFLPFVAAPLWRRGRKSAREILVHLGICGALFVAYVLVRLYTAEARVQGALAASSSGLSTAGSVIAFDIFYVGHSFLSYVYAAYVSIRFLSLDALFWTLGFLAPALVVLFRSRSLVLNGAKGSMASARRLWWIRNAVLLGLLSLMLSYALSYWHLMRGMSYPLTGRDTRVSVGAILGSSLLVASLFSFGMMSARSAHGKLMARAMIVLLVASLFGYSFVIQQDYADEWQHQRSVLAQLIMLTPDVTRDTLLLVREGGVAETLFPATTRSPSINSQFHGLGWSTSLLFAAGPQTFFVYSDDWKNNVELRADGKLYWTHENFPGACCRDLKASFGRRVITLVEREDGTLYRDDSPVVVNGQRINSVVSADSKGAPLLSNWRRFEPSPFVARVLPPYILSAEARDMKALSRNVVASLSPVSGSGTSQPFVVRLSDPEGASHIGGVFLMVQNTVSTPHSCWVYADVGARTFNLAKDDGLSWIGTIQPGSGSLHNAQCTVSGSGAEVEEKGANLELTFPLSFTFKGNKKLFLYVRTVEDVSSNRGVWEEKGSWLIP